MYAHNDELTFSDKLTKIAGAHGMKFGLSRRGCRSSRTSRTTRKAIWSLRSRLDTAARTGNAVGDILTGRVRHSGTRATRASGRRVPDVELRRVRAGLVEAASEPDARVRRPRRLLDEQRRAEWSRRLLRPVRLRSDQAAVPRPGHLPGHERRLLRVERLRSRRASSTTAAPSRCRASTSRGTSTGTATTCFAAATGCSINRNMGNVEYDNTLRLPPALYGLNSRRVRRRELRQRPGPDLHDARRGARCSLASGRSASTTLTPNSFTFPKTHSFSVSYARRIFFNQVVEASYVGTRGRDLVSRVNGNTVPEGVAAARARSGIRTSRTRFTASR